MPTVFLSPSTQEYNLYVTDGNEESYMNQIADAMEPYLDASAITYFRNDPSLTVGGSVRLSNAANPDIHLALHSNASPPTLSGQIQGTDVYYYEGSPEGEALSQLIAANMETIYPYPELVGIIPNRTLYELVNTNAPAVLVEVAYHDNEEDANWITSNIDNIARVMVLSLTQYFGIPFVLPDTLQRGQLLTDGFAVNLRQEPSFSSTIIGVVPNEADLIITGEKGAWYVVTYEGQAGFIPKEYIVLK